MWVWQFVPMIVYKIMCKSCESDFVTQRNDNDDDRTWFYIYIKKQHSNLVSENPVHEYQSNNITTNSTNISDHIAPHLMQRLKLTY